VGSSKLDRYISPARPKKRNDPKCAGGSGFAGGKLNVRKRCVGTFRVS
jgi:hypothetical protein